MPEGLGQAVGDAEDAAEHADVLAEDQDRLVRVHGIGHGGVQGLGQGDGLRAGLLGCNGSLGGRAGRGGADVAVRLGGRGDGGAHLPAPLRWMRCGGCGVAGEFVGEHGGLFLQLRGGGGEDVLEEVLRLHRDLFAEAFAQLRGNRLRLVGDPGGAVVVEQAAVRQVGRHPAQRVLGHPFGDFAVLPVAGGVVGVGVRLHPVGVGLHEQGAGAFPGELDGAAEDGEQRDDVVAVHAFTGHAVADGLVRERRRDGLVRERHGDRVLVVLDEEHHRQVEDGGEVQGLVEVALARGAVAAHGQDHGVLAAQLGGVGDADAVQQLGGQRGALDADLVLGGVVAAVPVAAEQRHGLDGVHAAGHHGHGVAVGGEHPVALGEAQRRGDLAGLLAVAGRVDGHPALPDECGVLVIDAAADDELLVGGQEFGIAGQGVFVPGLGALLGVGVQRAVGADHLDLVAGREHVVLNRDAELAHGLAGWILLRGLLRMLLRSVVCGDRHWSVLL